jgi:hypothetical protein
LFLDLRKETTVGGSWPSETADPFIRDCTKNKSSSSEFRVVHSMERDTIIWSITFNGTRKVGVDKRTINTIRLSARLEFTAKEEISGWVTSEEVSSDRGGSIRSETKSIIGTIRIWGWLTDFGPRMSTTFTITKEIFATETGVIIKE